MSVACLECYIQNGMPRNQYQDMVPPAYRQHRRDGPQLWDPLWQQLVVRYEIGITIKTCELVWLNGPWPRNYGPRFIYDARLRDIIRIASERRTERVLCGREYARIFQLEHHDTDAFASVVPSANFAPGVAVPGWNHIPGDNHLCMRILTRHDAFLNMFMDFRAATHYWHEMRHHREYIAAVAYLVTLRMARFERQFMTWQFSDFADTIHVQV